MRKGFIIAGLLLFAGTLFAQETTVTPPPPPEASLEKVPFNQVSIWDFVFGVGYNYRKFHKVKLYKGSDVPYYGTRGGRTRRDPAGVPSDPHWSEEEEFYDRPVHIGNADFGSRECSGLELNFGIPCFRHDALRVDALLGFMYYDCDTELHVRGAHTEYDMQMHTYDIGAKATYKFNEHVTASVSLGPSFNFMSIDSKSNGHNSDKDSLEMGIFAAAGVQFWFNKYIGVGAEVRYDKVFEDVDTRYSTLDLDTFNTDLKFLFRF